MEKLMDITQLSSMLGVKKSTIYSWVHTRKIPYTKAGDLLRFKPSQIERWIDKRTHQPVNLNARATEIFQH